MLQKSNYTIRFEPTSGRDNFAINIQVKEEFVNFLRQQTPNKESYEELGLETMRKTGWPDITKENIGSICMNIGTGKICAYSRECSRIIF